MKLIPCHFNGWQPLSPVIQKSYLVFRVWNWDLSDSEIIINHPKMVINKIKYPPHRCKPPLPIEWSFNKCVDEPKCNDQFLTIFTTQMEHRFSSAECRQNLIPNTYLMLRHLPEQSVEFCMEVFLTSKMVSTNYKMLVSHYSPFCTCDQFVSSTPSSFSAAELTSQLPGVAFVFDSSI